MSSSVIHPDHLLPRFPQAIGSSGGPATAVSPAAVSTIRIGICKPRL